MKKFTKLNDQITKAADNIILKNNPGAKFMLDLDITKKQLQILQTITKSHPYFPDLALDDFTFKNNIYDKTNQAMVDLIERGIITKDKKCLYLSKSIAKKYWEDIVHSIPVELVPNINREFLENSPLENLKSAYTTLTSSSPDKLPREKIITTILSYFENKGDNKMVKETSNKITPSMAAKENNISPSIFRKMLRKLYGKTEGNWNLTQDKVNAVLKALDEHRKEVAAGRSERMAKLQEARKKAQAAKKPVAKKAPAKK